MARCASAGGATAGSDTRYIRYIRYYVPWPEAPQLAITPVTSVTSVTAVTAVTAVTMCLGGVATADSLSRAPLRPWHIVTAGNDEERLVTTGHDR